MQEAHARAERQQQLDAPHVAPLTELVKQMRRHCGRADIPWVDPQSGGTHARVLLLLEAPGPMAAPPPRGSKINSSGFVSLDNDDDTAGALHELVTEAQLKRDDLLMWNIVPWYLGDATHSRVRAAAAEDLDAGAVWLRRLLELLTELRVAVLLGEKSQRGWFRVAAQIGRPLPVLGCPHPSPRSLNPHPERRAMIVDTLRAASMFAQSEND